MPPVAQHVSKRNRIVSHGTDDWSPADFPLNVPRSAVGQSQSSIVRDAGYSFEASEDAVERIPESDHALTAFGGQFEHNKKRDFLQFQIRSNLVRCFDRRNEFLPNDQLQKIMTYENIYGELDQSGIPSHEIHDITSLLCQRKHSRLRIFAILCMLQSSGQITAFIREEIYDEHLPFIFTATAVYREVHQQDTRIPIALFGDTERWPPHVRDVFVRYQGQVSAPFFKLSWKVDERVLHYPLKDQVVLPFIYEEDEAKELSKKTLSVTSTDTTEKVPTLYLTGDMMQFGGTSVVRRTKIHPAHYNVSPHSVSHATADHVLRPLTHGRSATREDISQSNSSLYPTTSRGTANEL